MVADSDSRRVIEDLGHDAVSINASGEKNVTFHPNFRQILSAETEFQGRGQYAAVPFKDVPGDSGSIIEFVRTPFSKFLHDRSGENGIFQRCLVIRSRAENVDVPPIGQNLLTNGAIVYEGPD